MGTLVLTFSGQVLACKSVKLKNSRTIDVVNREISLLSTLSGCRNVVQWYDDTSLSRLDGTIHLRMAYYTDGDLNSAIKKKAASGSASPFA